MSTLHLFNPSHDEALAAHSAYYYPTKAARTLATDLAVLPAWWAQPGDFVLLPQEVAIPDPNFFPNNIRFVHLSDLKKGLCREVTGVSPWGWDPLVIHQLRQGGIGNELLPDDEEMETIRQLSSRETAVQLLRAVRRELPQAVGESFWITDEESAWKVAEEYGKVMFKAPWSCSGRGVFPAQSDAPESIHKRVARILREQGGIEVEPLYERVSDFALEFQAEAHEVRYVGLSVFATTETGAYTGNIVADNDTLLQQLPETISKELPQVINSLTRQLRPLLVGHYQGPLGVDLMCVRKDDQQLAIHPCVEINLRNTMGQVALHCRALLEAGQKAIYRLQPVAQHVAGTRSLTPLAQQMEAVLMDFTQG